jgi:hypothetical protein
MEISSENLCTILDLAGSSFDVASVNVFSLPKSVTHEHPIRTSGEERT